MTNVKFTPEMALEAKKRHDEEVALVDGYTCLFRDLSLASDIVKQLDYAVDDINVPAFKAGVSVLAERGDFDYLTDFIGKVTDRSANFEAYVEMERALAKSMLALKNRVTMLHAYGKTLMIRMAKSELGMACAHYVSLKDFVNGVEQPGDSPELARNLTACSMLGGGTGASLKAWAKADTRSVFNRLLNESVSTDK